MKLILIRHEERSSNFGFFENLTDKGLYNAEFIIPDKINNITSKVDYIFSSPYYRTLQTIKFYAKINNYKINIENSLCEYVNNTYFIHNKWKYNWNEINYSEYNNIKKIFNNDYKSLIDITEINNNKKYILETEEVLKNRIVNFINYLKNNYNNNSTIILMTHLNIINILYYLYNNDNSQNKRIINKFDYRKIIVLNI
jgi:transcription factor C subunit 7